MIDFLFSLKPDKNLFLMAIVLSLLGCIVAILPHLEWLWWWLFIITCSLCLIDLLRLLMLKNISCERLAPGKMSLGLWHDVKITLHYQASFLSARQIKVTVFDHHPVNCEVQNLPQLCQITSAQWLELSYSIKPLKRGNEVFSAVQCLVYSPWSFWLKNQLFKHSSHTMVYPNFAAISHYALLATHNKLSQLGIKKVRRRGEGMDFNQLREYREGDSLKQIDWKATSRLRKLISREYQDEKDQEIIFLLDCGRRMLSHDDELSHFDHALNAMLLLSYVALNQGDAVGFATFANSINKTSQRWLKAKKGKANIQTLLNNVYDLHASAQTPDYTKAATQLLLRQKKRALIIILTNLRDEDNHDVLSALELLKKKHLVILANLKEQVLEQAMNQTVENFSDALLVASSCEYLSQRQKLLNTLNVHGINYLDSQPDKLALKLVNHYLSIKASGQL